MILSSNSIYNCLNSTEIKHLTSLHFGLISLGSQKLVFQNPLIQSAVADFEVKGFAIFYSMLQSYK